MNKSNFLNRQIRQLLIASGASEAVAIAAATHAIKFAGTNKNATTEQLIAEAKRYAKYNRAAPAPSVKRDIIPMRLPVNKMRRYS